MEDKHKVDAEEQETEENYKEIHELDEEAVKQEILQHLRSSTEEDYAGRYYWVIIHSLLTLATQGTWLFLVMLYWAYRRYRSMKNSNKEFSKTYRVVEEE